MEMPSKQWFFPFIILIPRFGHEIIILQIISVNYKYQNYSPKWYIFKALTKLSKVIELLYIPTALKKSNNFNFSL